MGSVDERKEGGKCHLEQHWPIRLWHVDSTKAQTAEKKQTQLRRLVATYSVLPNP